MADDHSAGDPTPEVFDPDRIDARFVVAMSKARNNIEVALRDGIAAAADDRPDCAYNPPLLSRKRRRKRPRSADAAGGRFRAGPHTNRTRARASTAHGGRRP